MKKLFNEFWKGATETTMRSWIGILVFCAIEIVACCVVFRPRLMAKMNRFYVMDSAHDEYAELSFRLIALRYKKLDEPHVSFMGPSNATRSIVAHDDERMTDELVSVYGKRAHFDVFATSNQRIEDALQMVDQFPPSYRGVVILQIHESKDDYRGGPANVAANRRRLALPSVPSILPIWRSQDVRYPSIGVFFIDRFDFFAARRSAALRFEPVGVWNGWTGRKDPQKLSEALDKIEHIDEEHPHMRERRSGTFTKSRRVMLRLASVLKKRGVAFMLVEAPRLPAWSAAFPDRLERFHDDAADFCAQTGAKFYDFNPDIAIKDSDFQDAAHLGTPAVRRAYTDLLLERAAEALKEQEVAPSVGTQGVDADRAAAGDGALGVPDAKNGLDAGRPANDGGAAGVR